MHVKSLILMVFVVAPGAAAEDEADGKGLQLTPASAPVLVADSTADAGGAFKGDGGGSFQPATNGSPFPAKSPAEASKPPNAFPAPPIAPGGGSFAPDPAPPAVVVPSSAPVPPTAKTGTETQAAETPNAPIAPKKGGAITPPKAPTSAPPITTPVPLSGSPSPPSSPLTVEPVPTPAPVLPKASLSPQPTVTSVPMVVAPSGGARPLTPTPVQAPSPLRPAVPSTPLSGSPPPKSSVTPAVPAQASPPMETISSPAKRLLSSSFDPTVSGQTQPSTMPLAAAIEAVSDRQGRIAAVKQYWKAAVAVRDVSHARDEFRILQELSEPATPLERSLLKSATAAAAARRQEAQLAYVAAQQDLLSAARIPATDKLPLPTSAPWVGAYETKFEQLFRGRVASENLRRINRSLPEYHKLVHARAEAVVAEEEVFVALAAGYQDGRVKLTDVFESLERLRQQRINFLAVVRDYNHAIADYALNAAGEGVSRDAVVSMLIPHKKPVGSAVFAAPSGVRSASALQPIPSTATLPSTIVAPAAPPTNLVPVMQQRDDFSPRTTGTPTILQTPPIRIPQ